ncbi:hypothetical protein CN138_33645 [Sinorhizobium meliloti]|uniref:hypothetical protein n=1 Tax=Rhizobium meliloti TaxID=382 RepID=UPI000FD5A3FB|nr:hypothetical protein [Sinorhizobium meliloti]MDW9534140.1 hypothetical protein [Sinorhizobium meliloti]MDW9689691.1 hypothetical protein [Sinorhizobium meliloti]MDX0134667.1 hypothetical protein [Sinorhizobium meliloti]RVH15939.1 hypothetical protein CN215_33755 [Sinorhizobium meliloti]RVI75143.1 hypothetical protein CN191_21410 [Sinorhizobium meliloti]
MEVDTNLAGDVAVAVATLLAAVVGGILVWWINRAAGRRRTASEREVQILKALEFLTGGTQKRSAGIGLLEGLFNESKAMALCEQYSCRLSEINFSICLLQAIPRANFMNITTSFA